MISVSFLTILAWVPIVAIILGLYYLLFWVLPIDSAFYDKDRKSNIIVAHIILVTIIWMGWSLYFFIEGKNKYIENHTEITRVQE